MSPTLIAGQLAEAASLMLIGMLVVFIFLTLLILAVQGLTWFCRQFPQVVNEKQTKLQSQISTPIPPQHIAAITAAFSELQKNTKL